MKLRKRRIFAVITVLIIFCVAYGWAARPDFRYMLYEFVRIPSGETVQPIELDNKELTLYTLDELAKDRRVSFSNVLMLINEKFTLPDVFSTTLTNALSDGLQATPEVFDRFKELHTAIREELGQNLLILSAYRDAEEQLKVAAEEGERAATVEASEHRTGLALDVCVKYFAGEGFIKTPAGIFTQKHCYEYGFIIRYPLLQKDKTGFDFEPWHLRYVGLPHSEIIYKNKLTLEQYVDALEPDKFYSYGDHIITRRTPENIRLPEFDIAAVSPDNTGHYIFTLL